MISFIEEWNSPRDSNTGLPAAQRTLSTVAQKRHIYYLYTSCL